MWGVPCKWRNGFACMGPWILQKEWGKMPEEIKTCTPTSSGSPLNRNQSRKSVILVLSLLHFTVCYPACVQELPRDNLSVMRHYLWARTRECLSNPRMQYSHRHRQEGIRSTYLKAGKTISETYSKHHIIHSRAHLHETDSCNQYCVYWVDPVKLPSSCPV